MNKSPAARNCLFSTLRASSCALCLTLVATLLGGCGLFGKQDKPVSRPPSASTAKGGGYYLDDGPGDKAPADMERIPDAVPRAEPLHRGAMRPYSVMGKSYTPMTTVKTYKARGVASWYGRRYHGKQTSTGEIYDMYAMSAAHPTLPLPSYVRVTGIATGKSVVVRVNDRGPFIDSRLIDLSYTAAHRIGIIASGSGQVEVEAVFPGTPPPENVVAARPTPAVAVPRANEPSVASADFAPTTVDIPDRAIPLATEASGLYLQLAAFSSSDNAEAYSARLRSQHEWLVPRLQVVARDGLFRVQAGPYSNHSEARQTADRISESLGIKAILLNNL
jgi:rare lipoprotein A